MIGITLFAVAIGGVAAVGLHFFSEAQESQKKSDSKVAAKKTEPASASASASANIIQKRKPEATQPKPVEEPPPVIPPTFQGEWDKAVQWSAKLDLAEPAATRNALQLLGQNDLVLAAFEMVKSEQLMLSDVCYKLAKYGLYYFIAKKSRSQAMKVNSDYYDVVKSLWNTSVTAEQIAMSASSWHTYNFLELSMAAYAIKSSSRPMDTKVTQLIASLPGGMAWLRGGK